MIISWIFESKTVELQTGMIPTKDGKSLDVVSKIFPLNLTVKVTVLSKMTVVIPFYAAYNECSLTESGRSVAVNGNLPNGEVG